MVYKIKISGILIYLILISIFVIPFCHAKLGKAEISKGWDLIYSSDEDYFIWIQSQNKQKTEICLLSKTATKINELPTTKNIYTNSFLQNPIQLNRKLKKANETGLTKDYYGYCRLTDTEDYLKFGEQSTILTYQNESRISYLFDENIMDITLYKNISGNFITFPESIFVYFINDSWKFGANDSSNTGLDQYMYKLESESNYPIINSNEIFSIEYFNQNHIIDFLDICEKPNANCSIQKINDYEYNIYFYSDQNIDPFISVIEKPSSDISITSLDLNKLAIARTNGNNITLSIFYTNGTIILNNKLITSSMTGNQRVGITAYNKTNTILTYYDDTNGNLYMNIFNQEGNNITSYKLLENIGGAGTGITDYVDFNLIYKNNLLYIGYQDDNENDADLDIFNISNLNNITETHITMDIATNQETALYNLIGCGFLTDTIIGCGYTDDADDDFTMSYINVSNATQILYQDVNDGVGNDNIGTANAFSNRFGALYWDGAGDIGTFFAIYNTAGTLINQTKLLPNTDSPKVALSSTYSEILGKNVFIASIHRPSINNITIFIIDENNTLYYSWSIPNINQSFPLISTFGQSSLKDIGFINDTFVIAFTNSPLITNINTYYINGTLWSGFGIDQSNPSATLIFPNNETYTNGAINFTALLTDDINLKNASLIIKNSTNGLFYSESQSFSGTTKLLGIVYNIITNGIFFWQYKVYDSFNNFGLSEERKIIYDTTNPIISYVINSEENNSISLNNEINVNISINDLSPTNTTIYLYNKTENNYTLMQIFSTDSKPAYKKFTNLSTNFYFFNATTCDILGYCSNIYPIYTFSTSLLAENIDMVVTFSDYPYAQVNHTINISVGLYLQNFVITNSNVSIIITQLNGTKIEFPLFYIIATQKYQNAIIFDEVGNYPFTINATSITEGYSIAVSGTFLIRVPFYITLQGFINTLEDKYINNFAYVTAELTTNRHYDPYLEPFLAPLTPRSVWGKPVWWAEYEDGEAIIRLWESNQSYALRLIDGIITFPSSYAIPNVTDSYGINTYIDKYYFDGTNQTLKVVFTEKDLHPYRWLANIMVLIILVLSVFIGMFLFFFFPQYPLIALVFTIILSGGVIVLRIALWLWMGV